MIISQYTILEINPYVKTFPEAFHTITVNRLTEHKSKKVSWRICLDNSYYLTRDTRDWIDLDEISPADNFDIIKYDDIEEAIKEAENQYEAMAILGQEAYWDVNND